MNYPMAIVIAAALIAGTIATTGARSADPEPLLNLKRLRTYVYALDNVIVNLAVDTERSAIGIAELNDHFRGLERRVNALEMKSAD